MCSIINSTSNILDYKKEIFASCDIVRGGIQQSHHPSLMMPFFALIMTESRLVRQYMMLKSEFLGLEGNSNAIETDEWLLESFKSKEISDDLHDDIIAEIKGDGKGYNSVVLEQKMRLLNICQSSANFEEDFETYLSAFDDETQELLGIPKDQDESFLGLRAQMKSLKAKGLLFDFVSVWAKIDLTRFDNSDITTLEEHIKREWADMSAATNAEQYTPSDIIALISDMSISFVKQGVKFDPSLAIYDMTCGGGNMLYGVEDRIKPLLPSHSIYSYGQEINDQLYALAKIESRFRENGEIVRGNTLTDDKLHSVDMDIVVANPPYGVDWKGDKRKVENDTFGRFLHFPSTSDGQLLFVQHAVSKLKSHGKALIVLNGSPMFSGDVNSGEAATRKWLLDNDYVEAWIQLPKNEFFNTGITTYLWVLNKDKPANRKGKVALIDASERYKKLKKAKGQKTNELDSVARQWIVDAFEQFQPQGDDVKIVDRFDFYYNKQKLTLIPESEHGTVFDKLPVKTINGIETRAKSLPINLKKGSATIVFEDAALNKKAELQIIDGQLSRFTLESNNDSSVVIYEAGDDVGFFDPKKIDIDDAERELTVKEAMAIFGTNSVTSIKLSNDSWSSLTDSHLSVVTHNGDQLGAGEVKVKASWDAKTKSVKVSAEVVPVLEKDYEIIPYSPDQDDNEKGIQDFINQWVRKRYILEGNNVGVEVNFNKIFYKPVVLRSTKEIADDIKALNSELAELEKELWG